MLELMDLSLNNLTSSLPPGFGLLRNAPSLTLSVIGNQLTGSVPATYGSLAAIALAYNPGLVGTLPPSLLSAGKLLAYSTSRSAYFASNYLASSATYGSAPTYGTGVFYGTSIGLDRPMAAILRDAQTALDPGNWSSLRTSWLSWHLQPCAPWVGSSSGSAWAALPSSAPGAGRTWTGVTCDDSANAVPWGGGVGILQLSNLGLNGTISCALAQLKTTSTIALSSNALVSVVPAGLLANQSLATRLDVSGNAALCAANTSTFSIAGAGTMTVVKTTTNVSTACTAASVTTPSCIGAVTLPSPPPPLPPPGVAACAYTTPAPWVLATFSAPTWQTCLPVPFAPPAPPPPNPPPASPPPPPPPPSPLPPEPPPPSPLPPTPPPPSPLPPGPPPPPPPPSPSPFPPPSPSPPRCEFTCVPTAPIQREA